MPTTREYRVRAIQHRRPGSYAHCRRWTVALRPASITRSDPRGAAAGYRSRARGGRVSRRARKNWRTSDRSPAAPPVRPPARRGRGRPAAATRIRPVAGSRTGAPGQCCRWCCAQFRQMVRPRPSPRRDAGNKTAPANRGATGAASCAGGEGRTASAIGCGTRKEAAWLKPDSYAIVETLFTPSRVRQRPIRDPAAGWILTACPGWRTARM
jgi:hypothetical protein